MIHAGFHSLVQILFVLCGDVTSQMGDYGQLVLNGDDSADHIQLTVAQNGHLMIQGHDGTLIDGMPEKDFGIVSDLTIPNLEVYGRGGDDQLLFEATAHRFVGDVLIEGGPGLDLLEVSGRITGGLLVRGYYYDPEIGSYEYSGNVIRIHQVTVGEVLGVTGDDGRDEIEILDTQAQDLVIDTASFEPVDFTGLIQEVAANSVTSAADRVVIERVRVDFDLIAHCHLLSDNLGVPEAPITTIQDVVAGATVRIRGGEISLERVWSGFDVSVGVFTSYPDALYAGKVEIRDLFALNNIRVDRDHSADFLFDCSNVLAPCYAPRGSVSLENVGASGSVILRLTGPTLEIDNLWAGDDLIADARNYKVLPVDTIHVDRVWVGGQTTLLGVESVLLTKSRVGGSTASAHAVEYHSVHCKTIQVSPFPYVFLDESSTTTLDTVVVTENCLLMLDYEFAPFTKDTLTIANSVFGGVFQAVTTGANDTVRVHNNLFLKPNAVIDGGESDNDADSLTASGNWPLPNILFLNFEATGTTKSVHP